MEFEYSSETSKELPFNNKGRECIRHTEQWVKNKKKNKDSGKAYTTYRGERRSKTASNCSDVSLPTLLLIPRDSD